jgi:hypothetical protein
MAGRLTMSTTPRQNPGVNRALKAFLSGRVFPCERISRVAWETIMVSSGHLSGVVETTCLNDP